MRLAIGSALCLLIQYVDAAYEFKDDSNRMILKRGLRMSDMYAIDSGACLQQPISAEKMIRWPLFTSFRTSVFGLPLTIVSAKNPNQSERAFQAITTI